MCAKIYIIVSTRQRHLLSVSHNFNQNTFSCSVIPQELLELFVQFFLCFISSNNVFKKKIKQVNQGKRVAYKIYDNTRFLSTLIQLSHKVIQVHTDYNVSISKNLCQKRGNASGWWTLYWLLATVMICVLVLSVWCTWLSHWEKRFEISESKYNDILNAYI